MKIFKDKKISTFAPLSRVGNKNNNKNFRVFYTPLTFALLCASLSHAVYIKYGMAQGTPENIWSVPTSLQTMKFHYKLTNISLSLCSVKSLFIIVI